MEYTKGSRLRENLSEMKAMIHDLSISCFLAITQKALSIMICADPCNMSA